MIRAMIFDLDGTLVQTERLKAISYARAVIELCPHEVSEAQVVQAFKEVVGLPRRKVAQSLVDQFDLTEKAAQRMSEFAVNTPWQALIQVRLNITRLCWPILISLWTAAGRITWPCWRKHGRRTARLD